MGGGRHLIGDEVIHLPPKRGEAQKHAGNHINGGTRRGCAAKNARQVERSRAPTGLGFFYVFFFFLQIHGDVESFAGGWKEP